MMADLRKVTLTVIADEGKVLLGMKKRGFGEGRWNGFGGKPNDGEELIDCVCRETHEEAGIILPKDDLELVGVLDFYFTNKPADWDQQVHVYMARSYEGEPQETDEMRPKAFHVNEIPYEEMWPDDVQWLPLVLEGKKVKASFTFGENGNVAKSSIDEVPHFDDL